MWEAVNGPIPEGKFVLHHCDNPGCINPDHLWIGTHSDNMIDMFLKGRGPIPKRMTHCYRGHEFTPENTMSVDKGRKRKCRTCNEINLARKLVAHRQRLGKSLDLQF
jgi:hypothetical protein